MTTPISFSQWKNKSNLSSMVSPSGAGNTPKTPIPFSQWQAQQKEKTPINNVLSPQTKPFSTLTGSDNPIGSLPVVKQLTEFGAGVGSSVVKGGLGLGKLFVKGTQGIANLGTKIFGAPKQDYSPILKAMDDLQKKGIEDPLKSELSSLPGKIGTATGDIAQFFAPAGAEDVIMSKASEHIDKLPKLLGLGEKAGKILTGALKIATKGTITGTSTVGVTAMEGGNKQQIKQAGIFGGVAGTLGQTLETFGKGFADSLNKADFKLSPAAEAKASAKAESAASFITDNAITGSDSTKYTKLNGLNNDLETTLQDSLPEDLAVPKQNVIDEINNRVETLKTSDPAIYEKARNDADKAIELLNKQGSSSGFTKGGTITLKDALSAKRSYGSLAFRTTKASVRDPLVVADGAYAVEQGFQNALMDTLGKTDTKIQIPEGLQSYFGDASEVTLKDFNKVYSNAITAKNFTYLSQFKKDTGLFGRLFGLWAGETVGQIVSPGLGGKLVGGGLGEIMSSKLPALGRNIGERVIETPGALPNIAKTGLGAFMNPKKNQQ